MAAVPATDPPPRDGLPAEPAADSFVIGAGAPARRGVAGLATAGVESLLSWNAAAWVDQTRRARPPGRIGKRALATGISTRIPADPPKRPPTIP